ncbi:MAG: hypothetical protein EU544_06310 [Promethearchaeota archaeon]|nr:MAG: hypothetical protein EU544_06310 [Candidatus Lokiarchaeota archaeon]
MDKIFGINTIQKEKVLRSNHYLYRLIIGAVALSIFIITSILVEINGILQALHDLGIFIPIFLLLFAVLMISSAIKEPLTQKMNIRNNVVKIKETTLISALSGNNLLWLKAQTPIQEGQQIKKNFRRLSIYQYLLGFVLFGQGIFLALKILWLPLVYIEFFDWWDLLIGLTIILLTFLFSFEIVHTLNVDTESEFDLVREILILQPQREEVERTRGLKQRFLNYINDFKEALRNNQRHHLLKVIISWISAILVISLSYVFAGFVIFIFI